MLGTNVKELPIEDFSGGLKTRGSPFFRKKPGVMTTPNCNGVYSTTGKTLLRMNGYTKITNSQKAGTGNGIYNFSLSTSSHKQMVQFGTVVYKMDNYDGTLDSLQTGVSNGRAEFDTFIDASGNKTLLYLNSLYDVMRSWDGTAGSMTTLSSGVRAKYLKVWKNRVWLANLQNAPNTLKWSAVNDYNSYDPDDTDDNFSTPEGDEITGLALLRGRMYVFKNRNIFRISYLGGTPLFEITPVLSGIGACASHTIKNCLILTKNADGEVGTQEVLIFMTEDKRLVAFDGTFIIPLSEAIEDDNGQSPVSIPLINGGALASTHAIEFPDKHQYVVMVPISSATSPSHGLFYDTYANGLWPNSDMEFDSSAVVRDSNNRLVPVATMNGYLYRLDSGNTNDGTAINAYYDLEVIDADANTALKKGGHFEITTRLRGTTTLRLQHRDDWDSTFSTSKDIAITGGYLLGSTFVLGTATLGGPRAGTMIYPFPFCVNNTQIRIRDLSTNSYPFEIYKIDFVAAGQGRAKGQ